MKSVERQFSIAVVGAGGLGTSAVWGLIAGLPPRTGMRITIIDPDQVELSNLHRQVLYQVKDVGQPKAECLAKRARKLPEAHKKALEIEANSLCVQADTIEAVLTGVDAVIDACDSTETKFLLNDFCVSQGIPLCYGGAVADHGQLLMIAARAGFPCLRCLFGELSEQQQLTQTNACRRGGIFGPVVGLIGFLQAEAVLEHLSFTPPADSPSHLVRCRLDCPAPTVSFVRADPECPLRCSEKTAARLNVRDKQCPETYLYTKLALERLEQKQLLDVRIASLDSLTSIIHSAQEEGYGLAAQPREIADSHWRVLLRR